MQKLIKILLDHRLTLATALIYTGLLIAASLMKVKKLPVSGVEHADKIYHTIAYFGLTLVWYLYFFSLKSRKKPSKRFIFLICSLAIVFGIFIEALQSLLTNYRTTDFFDGLANAFGAILALIVIFSLRSRLEKVKTKL